MRVFHFSEGTSHKFWSICREGNTQTVRFGRIGTPGQTATKEFATEAEAKEAEEALIRQKRKKGYVEGAPDAHLPAPRRRPAPRPGQLSLPF